MTEPRVAPAAEIPFPPLPPQSEIWQPPPAAMGKDPWRRLGDLITALPALPLAELLIPFGLALAFFGV